MATMYRLIDGGLEERRGIHPVDFGPYFHDGWALSPPTIEAETNAVQETQETTQGQVTIHGAILALINQASKIYELEPIPTVGKAAAAAIIKNRPEGGYESLDDLAVILPYRTDLAAIKSWGGPIPD
jgi:hypothetical protein